ncbi:MAG: hypothetical protein Fur0041_05170 [Bacteroidia bacterium]
MVNCYSMKKIFLSFFIATLSLSAFAQISVVSAIVPNYMQGVNGTNNNRVPMWFWVELSGLTPSATYRYYTSVDTLNAAANSNGAGNAYLVNMVSGTIRRTANVSMTNAAGYDSLVANSNGVYKGWMGVEPTANGRFTPGNTVYPKIMMNNGAGGTTVATRILLSSYPVKVINFGTASASPVEGTALYDSLNAAPKNFICVHDSVNANGRPVSIAIVEDDAMDLFAVTSVASFYRNNVDTLPAHWGTIIPNNLPNGIRALMERTFSTGMPMDTVTDADGWWCSGLNTVNMSAGNIGLYLNSTFVLSASAIIPDTAYVNQSAFFNVTSNDPSAYYNWDFGDASLPISGANVSHAYTSPGVYSVTLIITNGACSDTIHHNILVLLGTGLSVQPQLWFGTNPNPSNGMITVTTKFANEKTFVVFNTLGEQVSGGVYSGTSVEIDLTGYPKGIYFVKVQETETGKAGIKKIVLQ